MPCIVASDLSDEQVRAFRLVDNKTAELSQWDMELLFDEMSEIDDFDWSAFGFEFDDGFDAISDILSGGFSDGVSGDRKSIVERAGVFNMTFSFPIEYKDKLERYVKKYSKQQLIDIMLGEIDKCL